MSLAAASGAVAAPGGCEQLGFWPRRVTIRRQRAHYHAGERQPSQVEMGVRSRDRDWSPEPARGGRDTIYFGGTNGVWYAALVARREKAQRAEVTIEIEVAPRSISGGRAPAQLPSTILWRTGPSGGRRMATGPLRLPRVTRGAPASGTRIDSRRYGLGSGCAPRPVIGRRCCSDALGRRSAEDGKRSATTTQVCRRAVEP